MMSFKETLNEEQEILNEYHTDPVSKLIAQGALPLEPGMMERLGFLQRDQFAYHVTHIRYLEKMKKNQHKKTQISCFTKGGSELMQLPAEPNVLLMLKGDMVLKAETDIWTLVSTRNRRWLFLGSNRQSEKLHFLVMGVLDSIVRKLGLEADVYKLSLRARTIMINDLSDKDKVKMYKMYMSGIEKMLNKHYKVLIDYIKTAADYDYNEVILTKWEIMDVWSIDSNEYVKYLCSKLKLPYAGVYAKTDLPKINLKN